jgi:UDP-N-acetylglucosamine--N-acetylmuramyl-(pentapeptide) pyrophosphoryl-undecaprenol N-acetylglucosamine transferase
MERDLVERAGYVYESVSTGKLRRYFDLRNLIDLFRIPLGIVQAWFKLGRLKPDVIFSKGGFVGVPVVIAGWARRIPVLIHESDAIPGLASKLSAPFAQTVLLAYERAGDDLSRWKDKLKVVGNPVRENIFTGTLTKAKSITGFSGKKPVLLVMGGSSGSAQINGIVKKEKEKLCEIFDVIHITGKGKGRKAKSKHYFATHYAHENMKHFYALASLALTRAGANTLAELEALQIPALLYPLGLNASRGDQVVNAEALCERSELFMLADESKFAHNQLLLLPKAPKEKKQSQALDLIVKHILNTAS